jgi:hypothetical protein
MSPLMKFRARWARRVGLIAIAGTSLACVPPADRNRRASGDGARVGGDPARAPGMGATTGVVISELMYHPVLEEEPEELHEFIEIHNSTDRAVELTGWRLAGGVSFLFATGTTLPPRSHRVIAKSAARLAAIASYQLEPSALLGEYEGALDNGGAEIRLEDARGAVIDRASYDDEFPWPLGADALGGGEEWLPADVRPLAAHRHRGRSLERLRPDRPGNDVANWAPSPLDGATPGRPRAEAGEAPPVVVALTTMPARSDAGAAGGEGTRVLATIASVGPAADGASVEWFAEDLEREDEAIASVPMRLDRSGASGAVTADAGLPAQPPGTLLRYRVVVTRGGTKEVASPRPGDPYGWHGHFVEPAGSTAARRYHLYIKRADWTRLFDNVNFPTAEARVMPPDGCRVRASWDEKVPALLAYRGRVYEVRVRYQGSRWNRRLGSTLDPALYPADLVGPERPSPLLALSWHIDLRRGEAIDGRRTLVLNKMNQSCSGLYQQLGASLYDEVGIPVSSAQYARLDVNGHYYHYMLDLELPDEALIQRYEGKGMPVGDLFKATGCSCDEGPWGWADGRPLAGHCGFSPLERYAATYERKTNEWKGASDIKALIEDLDAARRAFPDTTALRAHFQRHWDVEALLSYLAVRQWAAPWDDLFHNHYFYKRARDGKWLLLPWDLDLEWGNSSAAAPEQSIFAGEEGDRSNLGGNFNRIKDGFFKAFRAEFVARLKSLSGTTLAPENVKAKIDEAFARYEKREADATPAAMVCSPEAVRDAMKAFADQRHLTIKRL